jgi:hypothetical protein
MKKFDPLESNKFYLCRNNISIIYYNGNHEIIYSIYVYDIDGDIMKNIQLELSSLDANFREKMEELILSFDESNIILAKELINNYKK